MCIDFDGHHSGGISFEYVYDILILLYKNKKNKICKESQYIVSHPKLGSDPPIGSDRESERDRKPMGGKNELPRHAIISKKPSVYGVQGSHNNQSNANH